MGMPKHTRQVMHKADTDLHRFSTAGDRNYRLVDVIRVTSGLPALNPKYRVGSNFIYSFRRSLRCFVVVHKCSAKLKTRLDESVKMVQSELAR